MSKTLINQNSETNTLPIHPYSIKALKAAIEEAQKNGKSTYNDPNGKRPPLLIYTREESGIDSNGNPSVLMVESTIPLSNYLPFPRPDDEGSYFMDVDNNAIPELNNKKTATLFELCCSEILTQNFQVTDKITGIRSEAFFFGYNGFFYVDGHDDFVTSIENLQNNFHIEVNEPNLIDFRSMANSMSDDMFWSIVDKSNWKKDFDYARINSFLTKSYDPLTLYQFNHKVSEKKSQLYNLSDTNTCFESVYTGGDGFSDCVAHIVGSGKAAFEKCMNDPAFFSKFANSNKYSESFSYAVPFVRQQEYYPYALNSESNNDSEIRLRALALYSMQSVKNIDYDNIVPKLHEKTRLQQEQAIYRLSKILEGDMKGAYQDFDRNSYNALSRIEGTSLGALVANCISDAMKKDGLHFDKVEWVNGKPFTKGSVNQIENNNSLSLS